MLRRRDWIVKSSRAVCALGVAGWSTGARAAEPGVGPSTVLLGATLPLTGVLGSNGSDVNAGLQAAFKAANASGGVNGRQVKLVTLDDGYTPARAAENAQRLIAEHQVFALASCQGTGTTAALLPAIEAAEVPLVGPVTGAASLRTSASKNVFHVRAGYREETNRLVQQMLSWGLSGIAIVYLDNAFGKEVLRDAETALAGKNMASMGSFALAADGSNADSVSRQVQAAHPGAVFLATAGTATGAFVAPFRKLAPGTPIAGLSVMAGTNELKALGSASQGIALTQVLPDPNSGRTALVRGFQAAMRAAGEEPRISSFSLEGWVNAQLMLEGLRRAGSDLRRDKLRGALAGLRRMDLGDFPVGFNGQAPYVASQFIDLAVLGAGGRRIS